MLAKSTRRLEAADVMRNGTVLGLPLARLLPVLRWLAPLNPASTPDTIGFPTSYPSPAFAGKIAYTHPEVWPHLDGTHQGYAVDALHPAMPETLQTSPSLAQVFAYVDALRGGRAREIAIAAEGLSEALDLPIVVER